MTIPGGFLDGDVLEAADLNSFPAGAEGGGAKSLATTQGGFTGTPAIPTGFTVTFTAVADRLYKITAGAALQQVTSPGTAAMFVGKAGSTFARVWQGPLTTSVLEYASGFCFDTPGAGSVTYSVMISTTAGTLTHAGATATGFLLVEDVGPTP